MTPFSRSTLPPALLEKALPKVNLVPIDLQKSLNSLLVNSVPLSTLKVLM
ncbi:unnamed protein product, partial [Rotaria magnacalcarata]